MSPVMGPVLGFQGIGTKGGISTWNVGVLVVTEGSGKPDISWRIGKDAQPAAQPVELKVFGARHVWRFDLSVKQEATKTVVHYEIAGAGRHKFVVPAAGRTPHVAYSSCNGFSSLKEMKKVDDNNALWTAMKMKHVKKKYHLILMGGDQLYADSMWETVPLMKTWAELPFKEGDSAPCPRDMEDALEAFYFDLYCTRWAQPEFTDMAASIPTVMMWDDHDIIDGWGSYDQKRQKSEVFKGIFRQARSHFSLFQLQGRGGAKSKLPFLNSDLSFSFAHRIGNLAIVVADMRSERTDQQVLSESTWNKIFEWIDNQKDCTHLYFMSSIPVVHPDFTAVERLLGWYPGRQEIEDDLRDHWNSRPHKAERLRLIHRLLDFAKTQDTRVTLLSGDVHVAALGTITSERGVSSDGNSQVINQLTSSGIVHPSPNGIVLFALEHLFGKEDEVDRGIVARMHKFPGTEYRFIGARNWLSLEPDPPGASDKGRIWANWIVEKDTSVPYTKVIHPCVKEQKVAVVGTTPTTAGS